MCTRDSSYSLRIFFGIFLAAELVCSQSAFSATLRGKLLFPADEKHKPVEVVLKQGKHAVSRVHTNSEDIYEFIDLPNGRYRLTVRMKDREVRQVINLCCAPNSVSVVDINLDPGSPTIRVDFPIEPLDIISIQELQRDYAPEILREYDRARQITREGRLDRAVEILQRILRVAPDFYGAHARLAMLYHAMGCYPEAEHEYVRARNLNPSAMQPIANLASLYLNAAEEMAGSARTHRYLSQGKPIQPRSGRN